MLSCFFTCYERKPKKAAKPAVHILMPLYNAQEFVCASVQSALKQSYPNLRILILDDGSTDQGPLQLRTYLSAHPGKDKVLIDQHAENRGVSYTRNELFAWSRKLNPLAYTLWLDSDDQYIDPDFINKLLDQMLKTQADIGLFNFRIQFEKGAESNALALMKDKKKIAGILDAIHTAPKGFLAPVDLPNLLDFTSLGWTKCLSPRLNLPSAAACPYEDFVYMAVLLQATRITALQSNYEPHQYLRRSTSICGQRKHENFADHIPRQLLTFFETVAGSADTDRAQKLKMAQSFVHYKLDTYKAMLEQFVKEKKFPGIDEATFDAFSSGAETVKQKMALLMTSSEENKADESLARVCQI